MINGFLLQEKFVIKKLDLIILSLFIQNNFVAK
jgi:hypothetical protein